MINKKRQFLKKKKPSVLGAGKEVPSLVESFSVSDERKRILYSAVYKKDPGISSHFRLPPSSIKGHLKSSPCTIPSSTFFPPPNITKLTKQPLYPLEIDVPEHTNNSAAFVKQFFASTKQDTKHDSFGYRKDCDNAIIITESPPNFSSTTYCDRATATGNGYSSCDWNHSSTGMEEDMGLENVNLDDVDLDDFSESSFDKDLMEFDRLCREVDIGIASMDESTLSCPICGIKLKQGSTDKDLEEHTATVCCPMDIIVIDD